MRRVEDFNNRERLFNIELTERDGIEDLIDDYSIYHKSRRVLALAVTVDDTHRSRRVLIFSNCTFLQVLDTI